MIVALDWLNRRVGPTPGARAFCPVCSENMIAKCGEIVVHHWAHEGGTDCDPWSEHETPWHAEWKQRFPADWREVVVPPLPDGTGPHRADVRTTSGLVIEIQHSSISPAEIREREDFYGRMIWVFDARDAWLAGRLEIRNKGEYQTFRWRHPRKTLAGCRRPVVLDLGDHLFSLRKIHPSAPCGGWGHLIDVDQYVSDMKRSVA